jgi:hypothetical protein
MDETTYIQFKAGNGISITSDTTNTITFATNNVNATKLNG